MDLEVVGAVVTWRGPAPYFFLPVPEDDGALVREAASAVSYGWGVVPVTARIGGTTWTTSLIPKDGGYLLPLRDAVRRAEAVDEGDTVLATLTIAV